MGEETIVAIATPFGRGGIGVVRIAGPDALRIASPMLRGAECFPGQARFCHLIDPSSGERLDEVVVTFFAAPHSYTTEDVIEISAHGSPVVLEMIVRAAIAAGGRLAEPGEFTRRAFLNGRLNLTQAEAVRDIIAAQTLFQAKVAAQQLNGALSRRVQPIKTGLVHLIATLEAGIDFAEDDVSVLPAAQINGQLDSLAAQLAELLGTSAFGRILHQGITLAIVGLPNVGKSSLFNRLVERERAIVTAIPGTTRDLVSETVSLHGVPLRLVDTAGIRDTEDPVERIGVARTLEALADADLVLFIADASRAWTTADASLLATIAPRSPLVVANKSDLGKLESSDAIAVSAKTGEGIPALRLAIWRRIAGKETVDFEPGALTDARHEDLVRRSLESLSTARAAVDDRVPHEMVLLDLYASLRALDALTGETAPDDILNLIFSSFCIGK